MVFDGGIFILLGYLSLAFQVAERSGCNNNSSEAKKVLQSLKKKIMADKKECHLLG